MLTPDERQELLDWSQHDGDTDERMRWGPHDAWRLREMVARLLTTPQFALSSQGIQEMEKALLEHKKATVEALFARLTPEQQAKFNLIFGIGPKDEQLINAIKLIERTLEKP